MTKFTKASEKMWELSSLADNAIELGKIYERLPWLLKLLVLRSMRRILERVVETVDELAE